MVLPALVGGFATGVGGGLINSLLGGGGSSSSSGGGGGSNIDFYTAYASKLAAENNPLTAAMQGLAALQGAYTGSLGQLGQLYSSGSLSVLSEAGNRSKTATNLQASEVGNLIAAATDLQKLLGQSKIGVELLGPQFTQQAGSAALAGQNQLAQNLGNTNLGLKALQEQSKAGVALQQAQTMGDVFKTRAQTQGNLALGAQSLESGLKLQQAKTLSNLATIKGQTKAQLAMERSRRSAALAGTRAFA
jgi:hypothetical protein